MKHQSFCELEVVSHQTSEDNLRAVYQSAPVKTTKVKLWALDETYE